MAFQVFDWKTDITHHLVTPQIRSRFLRFEPGQVADRHSHDLGHEVFFILQGVAHFEIEGGCRQVKAGQLCVALADEIHQVRNDTDEPMIMYLSVTPHIQPTHTGRNPDDSRRPTRFAPSSSYDRTTDTDTPIDQLIDKCAAAARKMADVATNSAQVQENTAAQLKAALAANDETEANRLREQLWQGIYQTFKQVYALGDLWNDLAPRAGKTG